MATDLCLEFLDAPGLAAARGELSGLLRACVEGGASIGFLAPLSEAEAADYWGALGPPIEAGGRALLVAREGPGGPIVGSGQLAFESRPNGRHRAEVCKVMVLPSRRRRGVAARLMGELERRARERSVRLLFLDTSEGPGGARAFYETLGYTYVGGIPEYALDPDGRPAKNAIFFKAIGGG
ncbi:MAG TPA: GNAT family N-acetyltransferase [Polyangiaceae bacterium]|nr:GNAT family N-acetyltransferase [Polyangiaceae bacterium]